MWANDKSCLTVGIRTGGAWRHGAWCAWPCAATVVQSRRLGQQLLCSTHCSRHVWGGPQEFACVLLPCLPCFTLSCLASFAFPLVLFVLRMVVGCCWFVAVLWFAACCGSGHEVLLTGVSLWLVILTVCVCCQLQGALGCASSASCGNEVRVRFAFCWRRPWQKHGRQPAIHDGQRNFWAG